MELSKGVVINDIGHLLSFEQRVYGVHFVDWPERMLCFSANRGDPKTFTDEWMNTEDGKEYQDEMDKLFSGHEQVACPVCGRPMKDNGYDLCDLCRHGITY